MPKADHHLSSLFRSLGPDEAGFQKAAKAAIHDVEERWPLLKALAPKPTEATPPLTADERSRWDRPAAPLTDTAKPTLSQPGLSDKIAQGLSKLAGLRSKTTKTAPQQLPETEQAVAQVAAPIRPPSPLPRSTLSVPAGSVSTSPVAPAKAPVKARPKAPTKTPVKETGARVRAILEAPPPAPSVAPEPPARKRRVVASPVRASAAPAVQSKAPTRKLFSKEPATVQAPPPKPAPSGAGDSSLKSIFNRLQNHTPATAPATKGRLPLSGRKVKP